MVGRQSRGGETAAPTHAVSLANDVTGHGGRAAFTSETRPSAEFGIGCLALRNHTFTVTGGQVKEAQKTGKPSNIPRRNTVQPDGNGDVSVAWLATTACATAGAIRAGDGRNLADGNQVNVNGSGGQMRAGS